MNELGAPDFERYFDFVELAFRAFWQKVFVPREEAPLRRPGIFARFLAAR